MKLSSDKLEAITDDYLSKIKSVKRFLVQMNNLIENTLQEKEKSIKNSESESMTLTVALRVAEEILNNFNDDPHSFITNFLNQASETNNDDDDDEFKKTIDFIYKESSDTDINSLNVNLDFVNQLLLSLTKDLPVKLFIKEEEGTFRLDVERNEEIPNIWQVFDEINKEIKVINDKYEDQNNLIKSSIIMTANNIEYLIQNLITVVVTNRFHVLNNKDNKNWANINYIELNNFENISEAQAFIINNFVERYMKNKKYNEWLEFIRETLKLSTKDNTWISKDDKTTFENFYILRNLIMHNNNLLDEKSNDKSLDLSLQNTRETIDNMNLIILKVIYHVYATLYPKNEEKRVRYCDKIGYNFLKEKEYILANEFYSFFINIEENIWNENNNEMTENLRYIKNICRMNYIQTFKWIDNDDKMIELLEMGNFDNSPLEFKYSKSLLLDDFESVNIHLKGLIDKHSKSENTTSEEIIYNYVTWPIAKEYHRSKEFMSLLEKLQVNYEDVIPIEL